MDGTQNLKRVELDEIRDKCLTDIHGYKVVRITHKEYRYKTKENEIKQILGIV